jgi:hypothetical protein
MPSSDCPLTTLLEIEQPYFDEALGYTTMRYIEVRDDDFHTITYGAEPQLKFSTQQDDLINFWSKRWNDIGTSQTTQNSDGSYSIALHDAWINYRFSTWSPTNPDNVVYDWFSIQI